MATTGSGIDVLTAERIIEVVVAERIRRVARSPRPDDSRRASIDYSDWPNEIVSGGSGMVSAIHYAYGP